MDTNNTPDTWDQGEDMSGGDRDGSAQISEDMAKLNVNASPFIPGQNVFAKEFTMPGMTSPSQPTSQDTIGEELSNTISPIIVSKFCL